ncbi:MAG: nucleotidyltransferase [Nitrospirae bacterium RIFOXYC2_FULL_44_7]|nr:MAG: nucleotidyltransferase [Nitrospirae bacterium RIFOXYC2_FULL_44_7]
MAKKLDSIIKRFRNALETRGISVEQIVLFGSYAENRQHEGSDIDLAIISDSFRRKSYWERIDILSQAVFEVLEPIEAMAYTTDEWKKKETMLCQFAHQGKVMR